MQTIKYKKILNYLYIWQWTYWLGQHCSTQELSAAINSNLLSYVPSLYVVCGAIINWDKILTVKLTNNM